MATTPMMQQYMDAKAACGDALLFFRMGDFYELFFEDAKLAAPRVGLTLTSRDKNTENPVAMAGFPHHQLESYLAKLIKQGFRVAICEQVEDPKKAKGLVKRDVTRVVSPGTLTDDALLDPRESNYLAAIVIEQSSADASNTAGLAWVELSTGKFFATTVPRDQVADELSRIQPAECLAGEEVEWTDGLTSESMMTTLRPAWEFAYETCREALEKQFGTMTLEGFGFTDDDRLAVRAAGGVIAYLNETQKSSLEHIDRLSPYRSGQCLEIDQATRRSLEITRTLRDGNREGSLLSVIDRSVTSMGSRRLADWIANPLTEVARIEERHDAIAELLGDLPLGADLQQELKGIYDMQRLLARVATGRTNPRDLSCLARTLQTLPAIKNRMSGRTSRLLKNLEMELDLCPDLCSKLVAALEEECPLTSREGSFLRAGYNAKLDELRQLASGGKAWIAKYQAQQLEESGIPSLKVGFNKVFGYYIEVTNSHRDKVPEHFIRKQTLKNAERYITPELKEYEEQVLSADEKAKDLEYDLFVELRDLVQLSARRLQSTADILAELDVLVGLADLARKQAYCRPQMVKEPTLQIVEGRHPVLDIVEPQGTFVPNDTLANDDDGTLLLITGPNMAGKSTYIRQVALITLMAQVGSYVPAKQATIGVADRIFARVGASDELSKGQSTFMVEMTETARILNTATRQSLVILDEIGRGTSTYDGLSLAWAIVEHLHDQIGCRTLFATHYHELTDLDQTLEKVRNLNVAVKEWQDNVVFLHKIVEGSADKSYGIHVARLAGIPGDVNERAKQILSRLEAEHLDGEGRPKIPPPHFERPQGDVQLTLFGAVEHPLLDEIRESDINQMTPLDALTCIQSWKNQLKDG
ncbi:MAG: DNA mismatch repair protein MutS [Pirellulaceae bacterium]|nr:DNA mismatch repair protein MutS [Pirellulaceae bacterium]